MTTTLNELIARARSQVRDPDGGFITDEDLTAWANEAVTDISARTEILQQEATGTTTGATITMPPGTNPAMVQVLSLRLVSDDVEFVTDSTWNSWSDEALTPDHTLARVFDNLIEMYPTPVTGTAYTLRYSKLPAEMDTGGDTLELPAQMERKVVEYMVAQGKYKDSEGDEGDRWLFRYEQGLPSINIGTRLNFPGPVSLVPDRGPFEMDDGYSA